MGRKTRIALFLILAGLNGFIYGGGRYYTEADVPMPEVQHELPAALVGEFIIFHPTDEGTVTIYPNNKYINHLLVRPGNYISSKYGHVIKEDGLYYFKQLGGLGAQKHRKKVIPITGSNWTFDIYYSGLRTARMPPASGSIAENITVARKESREQYYLADGGNKNIPVREKVPQYLGWYYSLVIDKGIVSIYEDIKILSNTGEDEFLNYSIWKGVLEVTAEEGGDFSGTIQFTNSPAFYNIADGIAGIEKIGNSIKIRAVCSEEIEKLIQKRYPVQSPVYLFLEF
jgi:hypothetical protein